MVGICEPGNMWYEIGMTSKVTLNPTKVADLPGSVEKDYAAWKQAKVARGLAQAKDRKTLIPAEQVWREFDLER